MHPIIGQRLPPSVTGLGPETAINPETAISSSAMMRLARHRLRAGRRA